MLRINASFGYRATPEHRRIYDMWLRHAVRSFLLILSPRNAKRGGLAAAFQRSSLFDAQVLRVPFCFSFLYDKSRSYIPEPVYRNFIK